MGRGKQGMLRVSKGVDGLGVTTKGAGGSSSKGKASKASKKEKEAYERCFCILSVNGTLQFFEDHKQTSLVFESIMVDNKSELLKLVDVGGSTDNDYFAIRESTSPDGKNAPEAGEPASSAPALLFLCAPSKQEKTDWLKRVANHIGLPSHDEPIDPPQSAADVHIEQAKLPICGSLQLQDSESSTSLSCAFCSLQEGVFRVFKDHASLKPIKKEV